MADDNDAPKTAKYKSIDDILEALKEHSGSDEPAEEEPEQKPSHVKTAKQLREELAGEPGEDQSEELQEQSEAEPPQPEEETPPQASQVFAGDSDSDDSPSADEPDEPTPAKHESASDVSFNLGNHPLTNTTKDSAEDSVKAEEAPAEPVAEHSLDDLAAEPASENLSDDFEIPHLKPSSPQNPNTPENPLPPTGYQARRANGFNSKQFDYTLDDKPRSGSKLHLIILIVIGILVIAGAVFFLKNTLRDAKRNAAPIATATPAPTETPSPTPTPLDRSKFKIRVLNGTPKAGLAASVSAKLKDLGYQTDRTGNATNSAFTRTVIRTKSSATDLGSQLVKDLASDFNASASGTLKEADTADGEVILGAK